MEEYYVRAENTYDMDKKIVMARITGRSKRVFSKELYESNDVRDLL
jgi:hypothetical protein